MGGLIEYTAQEIRHLILFCRRAERLYWVWLIYNVLPECTSIVNSENSGSSLMSIWSFDDVLVRSCICCLNSFCYVYVVVNFFYLR